MAAKKKERYRLEPLLIVKEKNKKSAELELGRAIRNVAVQKEKLKEFEQQKLKIIDDKRNARFEMSQQVLVGDKRVYDSGLHLNFLEKLQDDLEMKEKEIKNQQEVIVQAEENVKRKRREYIDASKEYDTMKKHKELWQKKLKQVLEAKELKEMNELGNVIHQLRNMGQYG